MKKKITKNVNLKENKIKKKRFRGTIHSSRSFTWYGFWFFI